VHFSFGADGGIIELRNHNLLLGGLPMKCTRDRMKVELLAEAEAVIGEALDWHGEAKAPTLTEVEAIVLKLRKRLGQRMAEMILENQETTQPAEAPLCPSCGLRMRYKGMKSTTVESRVGPLRLERGYYHCARCKSGIFPPG
jgi:DNA-directed RNA polymerase subunit RPC12/RpoP